MSVWYEIVVTGSAKSLRGFIAGFEAARDSRDVALLGKDIHFEGLPFSERLRELVLHGTPHVVIARESTAVALEPALRERGGEVGLTVSAVRVITGASFRFSARAFSPKVAQKIRNRLLEGLPDAVALEELEQREETDATSAGAELYSPVHDFVFEARGRFVGPLPGVLEMHRRARNLEFVEPGELHLEVKQESAP
jgi:hypothetical protein